MSKKNMLTIKEFADLLGLPKSKINYQVSKLDSDYIVILNGIKHLTKDGQTLIKQSLGIDKPLEDNLNLNRDLNTFEQFFEHFENQLNAKNQQIDKLHTLLDQQQQLTLQSNKQIEKLQLQLELKETDDDHSESAEPTNRDIAQLTSELDQQKKENEQLQNELSALKSAPKKGFWQRLFHS